MATLPILAACTDMKSSAMDQLAPWNDQETIKWMNRTDSNESSIYSYLLWFLTVSTVQLLILFLIIRPLAKRGYITWLTPDDYVPEGYVPEREVVEENRTPTSIPGLNAWGSFPTVDISREGNVWHTAGCSRISNSNITRYVPCQVCLHTLHSQGKRLGHTETQRGHADDLGVPIMVDIAGSQALTEVYHRNLQRRRLKQARPSSQPPTPTTTTTTVTTTTTNT